MNRQGILNILKQMLEEDRGETYDSMDETATLRGDPHAAGVRTGPAKKKAGFCLTY